jgi:hypothetical protein
MEKELRISFSEYQQIIQENKELASEVDRINKLFKENGRVIDLKIRQVSRHYTRYRMLSGFDYPFYEHVELTDTEKVVNELVMSMRKKIDDLENNLHTKDNDLMFSHDSIDKLSKELDTLKSRNWYQRLFNL